MHMLQETFLAVRGARRALGFARRAHTGVLAACPLSHMQYRELIEVQKPSAAQNYVK